MGDAPICNYCGVHFPGHWVHHTFDPIYFRKYHLCADKVWEDFQNARLTAFRNYDAMRVQLTDNALESSIKLLTLKLLLYSFLVNPLEIAKKLYDKIDNKGKIKGKPLIRDINATPANGGTIYIANEDSATKYRTLNGYYELMKEFKEAFFRINIFDSNDNLDYYKFHDKIDILRNSCAHADIWVETNTIFFKDANPHPPMDPGKPGKKRGKKRSGRPPVRILNLSSDANGRTCWDKAAAFLGDLKEYYATFDA